MRIKRFGWLMTRNISKSVHRYLASAAYKQLIVSLVLSQLDTGNATLSLVRHQRGSKVNPQSAVERPCDAIIGCAQSTASTSRSPCSLPLSEIVSMIFLHHICLRYKVYSVWWTWTQDRLRSSDDNNITLIPTSGLATVHGNRMSGLATVYGNRAFAGPWTWNNLLETVYSAPSLPSFRRQLNTVLFSCRTHTLSFLVYQSGPLGHCKHLITLPYFTLHSNWRRQMAKMPDSHFKGRRVAWADGINRTCCYWSIIIIIIIIMIIRIRIII